MSEYFKEVKEPIKYEGPDSRNPLAFKFYDSKKRLSGKPLAEHLRFSVAFWHTFKGTGADTFGGPSISREWLQGGNPMGTATRTVEAAFEFFNKLGVRFYCFHDADVAPPANTLSGSIKNLEAVAKVLKKKQDETGIRPLWTTSNLFSHRRYTAGAATNPDLGIFAAAAAQVKKMLEVGKELGEANHVFWGGREGYSTLLNTDLKREFDHLAAFLHYATDYAQTIANRAQMLIEPKPMEPSKHQYDFDAQSCHAFLLKYNLLPYFELNIETNHATLAGHTVQHELEYARIHGLLGSVDANRGDPLLGWDTDQFPDVDSAVEIMLPVLLGGGFSTGGLNFDARVRRDSFDPVDLFHAHVGAMDNMALGLMIAHSIIESGDHKRVIEERYRSWDSEFGKKVEAKQASLTELAEYGLRAEIQLRSGRQEALENMVRDHYVRVIRSL